MTNKKALGQHFTPSNIAEKMCALSQRTGTVLEPSSGDGAIFRHLFKTGRRVISIEKDRSVAHLGAIVSDFFEISKGFPAYNVDTVVMNPPYLKHSLIPDDTRSLPEFKELGPMLGSANLYAYFIAKSIKHLNPKGELIAIVPVDFLNSTSGLELRKWMNMIGVISKVVDLTDRRVFPDALPDTIVFRFSLDCTEKPVLKLVGGNFVHTSVVGERLGDLATVSVGAVPASKSDWESVGLKEELCEFEGSSGSEYYHPNALWIRPPKGKKFQLVCNVKSRHEKPFRVLDTPRMITGALLGVTPNDGVDIHELCDRLNAANWKGQFILQGSRFSFGQRTLSEALI